MMYRRLFYSFVFLFVLNACSKKDNNTPVDPVTNPPVTNPPVTMQGVQFDSSQQYLADTSWLRVTVQTKDPVSQDVTVKIMYTAKGLTYTKDFTTTPASTNGVILLTIPLGKRSAYFDIQLNSSYLPDAGDEISCRLDSAGTSMQLGAIREKHLISRSTVQKYLDLDRGTNGNNRIFINFDKHTAVAYDRSSWDLGFYTGQEDHRVILNSATGMLAYRLDKNDLNDVSAADTIGLAAILNFGSSTTYRNIDNPNGDLTKTAIAAISATPEDNKVYIINRRQGVGNPVTAPWKKVRILRNAGGGYTLQHADIASTTYTSVNITRDEAYYFNYISFENGAVVAEPKKEEWDIVWTSSTVSLKKPEETPDPYFLPQALHQNRNTKSAMGPSNIDYDTFSNSDVPGLAFNTYRTISDLHWISMRINYDYRIISTSRNTLYKFRFEHNDSRPFFMMIAYKPIEP
ncbi:MAG TPA: hypothetical protein VF008_32700 [Niastella sp.]